MVTSGNIGGVNSRIPYGMRGLKSVRAEPHDFQQRRIPYGMRGLKFSYLSLQLSERLSHPIRDAWIEIVA